MTSWLSVPAPPGSPCGCRYSFPRSQRCAKMDARSPFHDGPHHCGLAVVPGHTYCWTHGGKKSLRWRLRRYRWLLGRWIGGTPPSGAHK